MFHDCSMQDWQGAVAVEDRFIELVGVEVEVVMMVALYGIAVVSVRVLFAAVVASAFASVAFVAVSVGVCSSDAAVSTCASPFR